jgi:hypothetical protein
MNNLILQPGLMLGNGDNNIHQMSYDEAEAALEAEPRVYEVRINGKRISLLSLYTILGNLPNTVQHIVIRHPDYWEVIFSKSDANDGTWYLYRSAPLSKYGVLTRTFGTVHTAEEHIWEWLTDLFPSIQYDVQVEQIGQKKLANLRTRALLEESKHVGLPENLEHYLLPSYFEERPRPKGYGTVLNNFKKINTTLFQGGRKHKKSRTRKSKRSTK